MTVDPSLEEAFESRWEAAPAVALMIALQVALASVSHVRGWPLSDLPWWAWLTPVIPEVALLGPLALSARRHRLEQTGHRRAAVLGLLGLVGLANGMLLVALLISLIRGGETTGAELLFKAITVWATNVTVFGLAYWLFDRGGPVRRLQSDAPASLDFQFPQMENPQLAEPGWHLRLVDYLSLSFTNSIAFSPTDAMPLTRRMKMLMLVESGISALTVLLVMARAINVLQ